MKIFGVCIEVHDVREPNRPRLLRLPQIESIGECPGGKCYITMRSGRSYKVEETYEEIKNLLVKEYW